MERGDYLKHLITAIEKTHGLKATHAQTEAIKETFEGKVIWDGEVEVFNVYHPKATRCFAWGYEDKGRFEAMAVLGIEPVLTAKDAVKAYIASLNKPQ